MTQAASTTLTGLGSPYSNELANNPYATVAPKLYDSREKLMTNFLWTKAGIRRLSRNSKAPNLLKYTKRCIKRNLN